MELQEKLNQAGPISGYDCLLDVALVEQHFTADEEVVQFLHGRATWDGNGPKTSLLILTDKRILVIFTEMGRPREVYEIKNSDVDRLKVKKSAWNHFDSIDIKDVSGTVRSNFSECIEEEALHLISVFNAEYSESEKRRQVEAQKVAEQAKKEQAIAREQISSHLDGNLNSAIEAGKPLYHYRWIYLEIDSEINGDPVGSFNFDEIQDAGIEGWKVLGILPRTVGVGLKNTSTGSTMGQSWGGGIGGIVAGAYVILGREVDRGNSSWLAELKAEFMGRLGAL